MICKKDTEAEVLEKGETPLGSWRPARILSGNGHTYEVKYDSCVLEAAVLRNKVPRKALRPRPPRVEVKSWDCSDLVEICDDGSWKIAEVLRTLDSNMVVARLLESSKEIVSPLFQLRMPQIWKDNHWIPLQKESVKSKDLDVKTLSIKRNLSCEMPCLSIVEKKCKRVDRLAEKYDDSVDQWHQKSLGSSKKKSWECRSPVHPKSGALGKKKQIKKEGRCYKLAEKKLSNQPFEKVDAVNSAQNFYGEKKMYSAFCPETVGYDQIGVYHKSPIANAGPNPVVSLDRLDNESTTSSVGSCSVFNGFCRPLYHKVNQRQELCGHNNDEESFCGLTTEPSHSREDDKAETIHWLELDAYRSTLRLFYVSGSLSWEQESLLTNLRFALNISNDEHLSELKQLMLARN